jgi:hypothetical protein
MTTIPVFVNDRLIEISPGATAAAVVEQADPELAQALRSGRAHLTDGRGIAFPPETVVTAGAILRVIVSARAPRIDAEA